MTATLHPVVGRKKEHDNFYAQSSDFDLGPAWQADAMQILSEPGWAPYAIDAEARMVSFARMPPGVDLHSAPFVLITEYHEATHVLVMGFDDVARVASGLPDPKVVLVFSMGRCGTTLMSHALNGPETVAGLSEPPIFEHRPLRALGDTETTSHLIRNLCRLLFATRTKPKADTLAIKFRSQALFIAELFWKALPEADYIFMYRDAVSWGNSFLQFLDDVGVGSPVTIEARDFHWMMTSADMPVENLARFMPVDRPPVDAGAALAPGWTIHMEEYERLRDRGLPLVALRYNELVSDREGELGRIFDHCGISREDIASALKAFDRDSQEGTSIARKENKKRFTPEERASYLAVLGRVPALANPDTLLRDIYSA
ncbi:MAG TPA: hypothetical protein VG757_03785 [Devosia sp.]|nr:hypothetical protein [Devosia sp.]